MLINWLSFFNNCSRILARYQASHLTYQLKISSMNLLLADQSESCILKSGSRIGRLNLPVNVLGELLGIQLRLQTTGESKES